MFKRQALILTYRNRRGNFVYHRWGCTLIYWPLSYPFRSLQNCIQRKDFLEGFCIKISRRRTYKHTHKFFLYYTHLSPDIKMKSALSLKSVLLDPRGKRLGLKILVLTLRFYDTNDQLYLFYINQ